MILVSGANGNLAGAVIDNLQRLLPDMRELAVGTRNPESARARDLAARGISVRHMDFLDPDSLVQALRGIDKALFISTYDDNAVRLRQHRNAVQAAQDAGLRHIVYTSFINAEPGSAFEHNTQVHAPTEALIRESGLVYTVLRHNLYSEYLVQDLQQTLASGELVRGGGEQRVSFIGRDDLGVSAATVLAGDGHENRVYTETGPEALSMAEAAAILSAVFGAPVRHVNLTPEQWYEHVLGMGLPAPVAGAMASNVRAMLDDEFSQVSPDYATVTGRPARSLRRYLEDTRRRWLDVNG